MLKLAIFAMLAVASAQRVAVEDEVLARPDGWRQVSSSNAGGKIQLTFAVKQQNLDELERVATAVSDPRNPSYGKHMSIEAIQALLAPMPQAVKALNDFLAEHGVNVEKDCEQSSNSDFIRCLTDISTANKMLDAEYLDFEHEKTGTTAARTLSYTLPASVAQHIDFVVPTIKLPAVRAPIVNLKRGAEPNRQNTPASLRSLYAVGDARGNTSTNIQACTAFLNQHYKQTDLNKFNKKYYPANEGQTITVVGKNSGRAGVEASLDVEYISAMGGGVNTQFWTFAGAAPDNPENEPFLDFLFKVSNTSDTAVPRVISTSYGDCENTVSIAYMNRCAFEFQKGAARGITFTFATGDNGVGADSGSCTRFCGQWPAGSPWITGVGGTESGSTTGTGGETAWDGSAGGFSDRWAIPSYQADAVAKYKSSVSKLPQKSRYNNTGRGFPDVAAQAVDFEVINGGFAIPVAGTSCACPTFSGIIGLLNDLRLAAGKPVLGFMNPFIYQNADAFFDITSGNNPGCGTSGFEASAGWDAITGVGSPNYAKLAAAVLKLP